MPELPRPPDELASGASRVAQHMLDGVPHMSDGEDSVEIGSVVTLR
jgi:hypothetical protein